MANAERSLGRLDGATATLPNPDLFVFMYVRKEAVLSSQIEGTQSSLANLLEAEAAINDPDRPEDVQEVSNYVAALHHGLAQLERREVTVKLLQDVHRKLMAGQRGDHSGAGRLRSVQNWIGRPGSTLEGALFVPPPPSEVPRCLEDLERFLHGPDPTPPLLKVGLAHAQFETIHPFVDGNGRVGRLLVVLLLREFGLMKHPLLYLSAFFKTHRSEYYARLQATRDTGDWEGWLAFFLRGVWDVAGEAGQTAKAILALREEDRERVRAQTGKGAVSALELLDTLYYRPYITVNAVAEALGQTFAGANRLVARMVALGVLEPTTDKARNRVFAYRRYLKLFD